MFACVACTCPYFLKFCLHIKHAPHIKCVLWAFKHIQYLAPVTEGPRHLLGRVDSAGGAVLLTREQFRLANGYPNGFWGWGFEDHDFLNRLEAVGLPLECVSEKSVP